MRKQDRKQDRKWLTPIGFGLVVPLRGVRTIGSRRRGPEEPPTPAETGQASRNRHAPKGQNRLAQGRATRRSRRAPPWVSGHPRYVRRPEGTAASGWRLFVSGDGFESGSEPEVAVTYSSPLHTYTPRVGTRECPAVTIVELSAAAFAVLSELGKFHFERLPVRLIGTPLTVLFLPKPRFDLT